MSLSKIARNRFGDDIYALLGGVAGRISGEHWSVYALQSSYESMLRGEKEHGRLTTYSLLNPSIFKQFGETIVASACFEDTMLYRLWAGRGVEMKPISGRLAKSLRYQKHENGDRILIAYVSDESWSKTLRDRQVEVDGEIVRVRDRLVSLIAAATGGEPFAWMGNNDLPDDLFAHRPGAERLPNSPHGLNSFQHLHQVVVLSALNPPPAHFSFMQAEGIDGEELRTGHYRTAVYQAVMRISIRDPQSEEPKLVVVMDKSTAEWLADLFPGADVTPLDGLGAQLRKGKPGRRRKHETDAGRNRAYRRDLEKKWFDDLKAINGPCIEPISYAAFGEQVRRAMAEQESWDENTSYKDFLSRDFGSAFADKYASRPLMHLDLDDEEEFIRLLRDLHREVPASKEDNILLSPAHFDADMTKGSSRGLVNITHVHGIWMDNDGGDLTHKEFARLFPYLRIVVWNTYSSTPEKPRWRAFIPTSYAMSIEVHRCIMQQIEAVLHKAGYRSQTAINKLAKSSTKAWMHHGFDTSKFNAASLFYAPCLAAHPQGSFFVDYNERKRAPLDLYMWLDNCILDLRPEPEPIAVPTIPAISIPAPQPIHDESLRAVSEALNKMKANGTGQRRQAKIDKAIDDWRGAFKGDGHNAFFRLGVALKRAGLDESDIQQRLREEAGFAHSPAERRKEIRGIMRSLKKIGGL